MNNLKGRNARGKILLLTLISMIRFTVVLAQEGKIDSLQTILKTSKQDTNKVNTLNALSDNLWRNGDYEEAKKYAYDGLSLAEKIIFQKGMAVSYNNIGSIYYLTGSYPEALKNYFASLKINKDIGNKKGIAVCYGNIANIYDSQGRYSEALENHFASLKINKDIEDKKGMAACYANIANIYEEQGNYPEALKNNYASIKIEEEIGHKEGIADSYNNIGIIYFQLANYSEALKQYSFSLKIKEELGDKEGIASAYNNIGMIYWKQGNYLEALKQYSASLKISEEIDDPEGIAVCYGNIGNIYYEQTRELVRSGGQDIDRTSSEALKNYFASLEIFKKLEDKYQMAVCYNNLGAIYILLKKISEAQKYFHDGLLLSKEIGSKSDIKESYSGLASLDSAVGHSAYISHNWKNAADGFKQSLQHYKLYTLYQDSLLNESNNKQIAQMKTLYETEKKDNEIALLNKDKEVQQQKISRQLMVRNGFITGFSIVLLFAGVFFRQRNRIGREKRRSDELLLNILPSETAQELKQTGAAKAKSFEMVTVMFADFKNFTQASERMTAEELVKEIHYCYSQFDKIIAEYGVEKIKTIGDGYLCAGGLPVENKTNPEDTIKAAIEIQRFLGQLKKERITQNRPFFEARIGIHTGAVVAGIVGIKKFAYDIWGDTVNIASRVETSGEVGKVNISETTYELVKDKFKFTHRGKIEAKNKGEISMYFADLA